MAIKVISFDLDGTLIDKSQYDDVFWFEEIPKLISKQRKISFEEAKKYVTSQYDSIGDEKIDWYLPSYWFNHFKLKHDWSKVIYDMRHRIKVFKETIPVLRRLGKKYKLIVITHSSKEFLKVKMKVEGLEKYFDQIISTVSDLNATKKEKDIYKKILKKLKLEPEEMVHVGDSYKFDFLAPREIGMTAYYLDRQRKRSSLHTVKCLAAFEKKLKKLNEIK